MITLWYRLESHIIAMLATACLRRSVTARPSSSPLRSKRDRNEVYNVAQNAVSSRPRNAIPLSPITALPPG